MIKVIDNALDEDYFYFLKNTVESDFFPWYFNNDVDFEDHNTRYGQLVHVAYDKDESNSSLHSDGMLNPVYDFLSVKYLIRSKFNLLSWTSDTLTNSFHIDTENAKTAILYINTNNGKTIFKDGTEVNSVENRIVIFNSNTLHTGTTCTDSKRRILLNVNYHA